jgi:hypothetical protein
LRLLSVVDEKKTIIDKKTIRYYVTKDSIRLRYKILDHEINNMEFEAM